MLRPANVFRYIQTVDGRFSDSSGVLMKYFIQPVDPRVLVSSDIVLNESYCPLPSSYSTQDNKSHHGHDQSCQVELIEFLESFP